MLRVQIHSVLLGSIDPERTTMNVISLLKLLFLCLTFTVTFCANAAVRNGSGEEIMLQGFHWNSSRNPIL